MGKSYTLNLRPEYIREIYSGYYDLKPYSSQIRIHAYGILLFLLMCVLTFLGFKHDLVYWVLTVVFFFGAGFQTFKLYKILSGCRIGREQVEESISTANKFHSHQIYFEKENLIYKSDEDILTFPLQALSTITRSDNYILIQTKDNQSALFIDKSFDKGEYELFVKEFDEMLKLTKK